MAGGFALVAGMAMAMPFAADIRAAAFRASMNFRDLKHNT